MPTRQRRIWLVVGLISLITLVATLGLNLGRGRLIDLVASRLIGVSVAGEIAPDTLTIDDFPDIPGVTREFVEAYKIFLKAKAGDRREPNYEQAVGAFQRIAQTTENPELKLRSLYLVTLGNFLQLRIAEAYESAREVFRLSKSLYGEDKRVKLLEKLIALAERNKLTPSSLKSEIADEEINSFIDILARIPEGAYRLRKMEDKTYINQEKERFFKDFSASPNSPPGVIRNLIPGDSSFETGLGRFSEGGGGGRTVVSPVGLDPSEHFDGHQSLKLEFLEAGWKTGWMQVAPVISTEEGKTYTFSLYAKADREGITSRLSLIRSDWGHTVAGTPFTLTTKWERYSVTGKLTRGFYWLCFGATGPSFAWIDACQFEEGSLPTAYKNKEPISLGIYLPSENNYVFFPDEDIKIDLSAYQAWEEANTEDLRLSYQITDMYKNIVKEGEERVTLNEEGRFKKTVLFQPGKLGLFVIRCQLRGRDLATESRHTLAVVKPPVEIEEGIEPFMGVCGDITLPGLRRMGNRWGETIVRWGLWHPIEPIKDEYNWRRSDSRLSFFKEKGYKNKFGVGALPSTPEWVWDKEEAAEAKEKGIKLRHGLLPSREGMEEWRELIHQLVMRYKDFVDVWEVGAEDDLSLGRHPYYHYKYPEAVKDGFVIADSVMDRYAEMIKIAASEIRKVVPEAKIGAIRPSGVDSVAFPYTFSREAFKRVGREFNLFPIDPYTSPWLIGPGILPPRLPEEFLPRSFQEAFAVTREYGLGQPIFVSELGWAFHVGIEPDSFYAREMVKRFSRAALISRMTPGVLYFHWFADSPTLMGTGPFSFALWYEGHPMATVPAFSAVAQVVENVIESKKIDLGGNIWAVVFKKPHDQASGAIWLTRGEGEITISANPQHISILDVMGNPLQTRVEGGKITFEIGELPVYLDITRKRGSFEELGHILSSAKLHMAPVRVYFTTRKINEGMLYLQNLINQDLVTDVSISIGEKALTKRVNLPKGERVPLKFALPEDIVNRREELKVGVDCGKEFRKVSSSFPIEFEKVRRAPPSLKIDGNLSEWKGFSPILMNRREQIIPPDPHIDWTGVEDLSAKVYIGWDRRNFYLAAEVTDEKHFNNQIGSLIWNGDSIQFAFDPWVDASLKEMGAFGPEDVNLGIALTKKGPLVHRWYGQDENIWSRSEFAVVRDEANKRTFYEVRIPFVHLHIFPKQGTVLSFNFVIFDDDTGAGQTYWYQHRPGIAGGKNPYYFKKFAMVE